VSRFDVALWILIIGCLLLLAAFITFVFSVA